MTINTSVGIIVHNEAKNISNIINSYLQQKLSNVNITEIIVVSSGSTDATNQVVESVAKQEKKIRLMIEPQRKGKISGVNIFLKKAKESILILSSGDLLLDKNCVENLCSLFSDPKVGMTGVHSIPINDQNTFWGYAAHILWELHHQVSLYNPKMGETVAFRKCFESLSKTTSMDEASIELLIKRNGSTVVYVPNAIIYNKSPTKLTEFIAVRRRNFSGHISIKNEMHYEVATLNLFGLIKLLPKVIDSSPKHVVYTLLTACIEVYSRFLGYLDYKFKLKQHVIWETAHTARSVEGINI